ncbi:hypothetical protein OG896_33980 [Streptomyces sp. NBC_00669]|uniref:hypothetical protein n=1 Tax=Streptomyces sp. NBC_00669 TaxID=2976011 RepID=UPI002E34E4F6|nr:hypothetical protein [Streptomyces sp. NBC_00669]
MKLRGRATTWAALPAVALTFAVSGCGGGISSSEGTKQAKEVRSSTAMVYWKVRSMMPTSLHLDTPEGSGNFVACSEDEKNGKGAVKYDLADYLDPENKLTMAQLVSGVENGLKPLGWTFATRSIPTKSMPDAKKEKLYGWAAHKGDFTIELTFHEASKGKSAAGYFDVLSACKKYGKAQKKLLSQYANGNSFDTYDPRPGTPQPVPTGFPSPAL